MMMNLTNTEKNQLTPKHKLLNDTLQFIPGIWVNGQYYWLQNRTEMVLYDEEIIIKVKQEQLHSKIRFYHIYVSNHSMQTKDIKVLAMHHFSNVSQDNITFISPIDDRIFHHTKKNVYLVNGLFKGDGLTEYTAIPQWYAYTDQIWNSLQKGSLKYQPIAKGPAASIFAIKMSIHQQETSKMNTWTITGTSKNELLAMEEGLFKNALAFPFEK